MKTRIISALVALPILFFILQKGGIFLYIAAFLLSIIGEFELFRAFTNKHYKPLNGAVYIVTFFWYLGLYLSLSNHYFSLLIMLFLFCLLAYSVFSKRKHSLNDMMITFFGFFYVGFTIAHLVMISKIDANFFIWYPFIIAFVTDTFAYFVGKYLGKSPLIPSVSPNKTIEGSIGGIIGCVIFSFGYAWIFNKEFLMYSIVLGLLGSVLSQLGDLIASKIKRSYEIKDFGNIMPGHGGILDRFDSLIVTLPLVYYFMTLFLQFHTL